MAALNRPARGGQRGGRPTAGHQRHHPHGNPRPGRPGQGQPGLRLPVQRQTRRSTHSEHQDGGDINAISGATITSRAVANAANQAWPSTTNSNRNWSKRCSALSSSKGVHIMAKSIAQEFTKGLWKEIAPFRLVLGLCPVLGVTTSMKNGIGMGLATTFVLLAPTSWFPCCAKYSIQGAHRLLHHHYRIFCHRGGTDAASLRL
jgi:hypothetical protein